MSAPSTAERIEARALYLRLVANPTADKTDARKCVDVLLRLAEHEAELFGLPRFPYPHLARQEFPAEGAVDWIDRVATGITVWRERGIERVQESEERRSAGGHRDETRTYST